MRFPTPHTVIFAVMIAAAAATWIVPAGQYDTMRYDATSMQLVVSRDGSEINLAATQATLDSLGMPTRIGRFTEGVITRPVKVPNTYSTAGRAGQGPIDALFAALKGFTQAIDIILLVMMIGGFVRIYTASGVLQLGVRALADRFRGHERWLIIILVTLTAAGGTTFGLGEETMAFYPILVPVFLAAGYDRLVPVAVIFGGSTMGFMASTVNPFSVMIASNAAGVSWSAGLTVRIAMLAIGIIAFLWYTLRYAERVRLDPSRSHMSEEERLDPLPYTTEVASGSAPMTGRQQSMLTLFGLTFVVMVAGVVSFDWWMAEMAALFLASGLISGVLFGLTEKKLVTEFIHGASDMIGVSLIIGLARGVTVLLNDGLIVDTVLLGSSNLVASVPHSLFLVSMIGVFFVLALLISSSSGLALVTMPILGALAVTMRVPGESIVTSYTFGSGLMSFIGPTGLILPSLAMVNLKYSTWLRFMMPLLGILFVVSVILVAI